MNPIAFRIPIPFLNTSLDFTWYGISIVIGVLAATLYAARQAERKGEDPNNLWDMFIFILIFGIIGARLWYVITSTLGGNALYVENPVQILNIRAGGTNIFGALLAGMLTVFVFCRVRKINPFMYLDFIGPGVLLGQALARWGNYVNQELYGPPTTLPWGIRIDAPHRIPPFNDIGTYPLTTRFHPTFLYETVYDLLAFTVLVLLIRRRGQKWHAGVIFGAYLVAHGIGRFFIEFFRPDQPRIAGTPISYSRILALLFVVVGALIIWWRQRRTEAVPALVYAGTVPELEPPAEDIVDEPNAEASPAPDEPEEDRSDAPPMADTVPPAL